MGGRSVFVCARFTHLQMVQKKCIIKHELDTTNKMMLEEEIQDAYYRSQNKEATREKLNTLMLIKKVITLIAFMFLFARMLHIAGAKTFVQGVLLAYGYALALFAWDTFFLDWVLFANIKKIRLPGTEHMDKEYHQKWFHVKGCIPMIPVFAVIGALSSLLVLWIW